MPNFDIIKEQEISNTFRVKSILGMFDIKSEKIQERFTGEIKLDSDWKIGLIVGKSGTGKTTIAKQLFTDSYIVEKEYKSKSVIDDMPKDLDLKEIVKCFNSVGFNSPPSWLKPYDVLSNGEKMRVDLASAILNKNKIVVFDEFTSVVDRQVAKIASFAIQKAIRKTEKQFIAVTCHFDVEDWLLPDWVFNTDNMTFQSFEGQKKNRPNLEYRIYETKKKEHYWRMFSRYHYLNHSIHKGSTVFILTIENVVCGFCAVLQLAGKKNMKQGHRLVILPEYQGLGLSSYFLKHVGDILKQRNTRFVFTTSNPAMINFLKYDKNWRLTRKGRQGVQKTFKHMNKTGSSNRYTTTWEFLPTNRPT